MKLGLLLIVAASAACTSKELPPAHDQAVPQAGTGPSATGPAAPAGSVASYAGEAGAQGPAAGELARLNMTGRLQHQAANCPCALPGATTRLTMTPRGVDVAVTSEDDGVAHHIVQLAVFQASGLTRQDSRPHDQLHGGPAWLGYCPIIVNEQTRVTATLIPHGAVLHVEARSPNLATYVQQMIKARAAKLPGYASS